VGLSADRTYYSFPVASVTKSGDGGDLYVEGLATDGHLDHDDQVVDQAWAAKAFAEFFASGPNIRMAHRADSPVGVGVDWSQDPSGGIRVKSLIVHPVAVRMCRAGVLRAYSVGISHARVVADPIAKGGRIASGCLVELSLVDRPSNARCGIMIAAKAADGGGAVLVNKAFGGGKAVRKAAKRLAKSARVRVTEAEMLALGEAAAREIALAAWLDNSDPWLRETTRGMLGRDR
jgi:hypothetical protein